MSDSPDLFKEVVNSQESLPFSPAQIEATLGYLMTQEEFFRQAVKLVKYHWFESSTTGKIWDELCLFHKEFGRLPLKEEFKGWLAPKPGLEYTTICASIDRCLEATKHYGFDFIRKQCTSWLRAVLIKETYSNLYNLYYNKKNIPAAMSYADTKVAELRRADFVPEKVVSFADIGRIIVENEQQAIKEACTTGTHVLDRALLNAPDGSGGLALGDNTVIMAPISVGKTSFMCSIAIHNIRNGRDVLLIAHEDTEDNLRRRILCCALKCPERDLITWHRDPVRFKMIQEWSDRLEKHLTYLHLQNPTGTYVEDVINTVVQRNQERKRMNNGKGYDLLIDDYPGKLLTRERSRDDLRIKMHFIYTCFADVAATEKMHCLSAVQANRSGAKANREQERALVMEDVAEAWGIPQIASNFLTLNRAENERSRNIIHINIDKCRRNEPGKIVTCPSRMDFYCTHGDDLGSATIASSWERVLNHNDTVEGIPPNGTNGNAQNGNGSGPLTRNSLTSRAKQVDTDDPSTPTLDQIQVRQETLRALREHSMRQSQALKDAEETGYLNPDTTAPDSQK